MALRNKKILITSGPTRMPLDAVRFISNRSTGHFGTLLAQKALKRGAKVAFVYGAGSKTPKLHRRLKLIRVETNPQVATVLKTCLKQNRYDAVIHAMAVLDFQAAAVRHGKTKTQRGLWNLKLVPTPKIIAAIKKWSPETFLVGFKLEVDISQKKLLARARALIKTSRCDLVLANQLLEGDDSKHPGWLLNADGKVIGQGRGKALLSKFIIEELERLL